MTLAPIDGADARRLLDRGALLVDIREEDERRRFYVPGSLHAPISQLPRRIGARGVPAVIFLCDCGVETLDHARRLRGLTTAAAFRLEGGIQAWRRAGLPVAVDGGPAIGLARQVELALGALSLLGLALGELVHPGCLALSALAGLALIRSGLTGRCGLANGLRRMPWNQMGLPAD
ncbi:rhodanese-like domain-containing protein [Rubellimicrobium arenae]|uniref:rhodanese-like domain-containing protein n=1 Tax=Rubellimicrobium arenae TaxID=2817372 RepID=UPI001B3153C9|nr:rhodanese-like domain-containing protein [Rubellimicrobium arenae]